MKHFYSFLLFILITGCQQQQVPEVFYELDAQTIINQTRAMKQLILYQAPLEMIIDKELETFHGKVVHLDKNVEEESIVVKIENEMGVILEFDVSSEVVDQMDIDMELAVRYMRDKRTVSVVEIKKANW